MTDASVLSATESLRFLQWLDPVGLHNLVALDPAGIEPPEARTIQAGDWGPARAFLLHHNGKRNIYFSINAPRPDARRDTKLRRDEIGAVRAFHVDIDKLDGTPDWDMDCMPSTVIDSGGGQWGFWKLAEPLPVENVAAIEAQNKALTGRFHGDAQAHNLDRIARLPGTINIPNAAKRKKGRTEAPARILSLSGLTYSPAEVAAWCPPVAVGDADLTVKADQTPLVDLDAPASVARATRWLLGSAGEAVEGDGGNQATYEVAARLKDFGVSQQVAFELMLDCWNEEKASPPWPARDLLDIVKNAYRYGTAAPGKLAGNLAETEFDAVPDTVPAAGAKRTMQAEAFSDIAEDFSKAPNYLIEDWYDRETMIVTYGESNSGKTHVVLDQALAIAAGRPWAGKKTQAGLVVYVAAEGGKGVRRRVMAHRAFRPEMKGLPFALVVHPINLMHQTADAKALVALVKAEEARFGLPCVMVVVDTLSRALAGGDENSSADMGAFVKRCDEIRFATGAALHVIHHAGKNTAKGARGHSLLRAAVDTEIEIESQTVISRKQRDMEVPQELRFDYKQIQIGARPDGSEVRSVVLDVWQMTEFDVAMPPQTQRVFDVAEELVMQKIQNVGEENAGPETPLFSVKEVEARGFPHTTVDRAFAELVQLGVFAKCKRGLYKINRNPKTP